MSEDRTSPSKLTAELLRRALRPLEPRSMFRMDDWLVWCGSTVRTPEGVYYLLFSRWPRSAGHDGWVTQSQIACATANDPCGPYTFRHVVLAGSGGDAWDADVFHNPTVITHERKYYLYYMGNRGDGSYWNHRNNQRIGVAVSDHPAGPWTRHDRPLLDVTPGAWDGLMVSNPTVCRGADGRFVMVYKGVAEGMPPKGGAVLCGVAFANHPLGPFVKHPQPIIFNPEHPWAVEDPFVWTQGGQFYCIVKDFQGHFAQSQKDVLVLFESLDAIRWKPTESPLFLKRKVAAADGQMFEYSAMERPQIYFDEQRRPKALSLACATDEKRTDSFNIQLAFEWPGEQAS